MTNTATLDRPAVYARDTFAATCNLDIPEVITPSDKGVTETRPRPAPALAVLPPLGMKKPGFAGATSKPGSNSTANTNSTAMFTPPNLNTCSAPVCELLEVEAQLETLALEWEARAVSTGHPAPALVALELNDALGHVAAAIRAIRTR